MTRRTLLSSVYQRHACLWRDLWLVIKAAISCVKSVRGWDAKSWERLGKREVTGNLRNGKDAGDKMSFGLEGKDQIKFDVFDVLLWWLTVNVVVYSLWSYKDFLTIIKLKDNTLVAFYGYYFGLLLELSSFTRKCVSYNVFLIICDSLNLLITFLLTISSFNHVIQENTNTIRKREQYGSHQNRRADDTSMHLADFLSVWATSFIVTSHILVLAWKNCSSAFYKFFAAFNKYVIWFFENL